MDHDPDLWSSGTLFCGRNGDGRTNRLPVVNPHLQEDQVSRKAIVGEQLTLRVWGSAAMGLPVIS
jgi:hypothetical protein